MTLRKMANVNPATVIHAPTWFGAKSQPLFGWLSYPQDSLVKGGVILALPVGYEARGARRAMRALANSLAENGYVALRFDYRGTGDSSGNFGSTLPNPGWLEDVASAVAYLRECGVNRVSAVGMRLGATLVGLAASHFKLDLSSLVAWDPCESGRSYLRELRALETLRHENNRSSKDGSVETAEFLFPEEMVNSVQSLNLSQSTPATFADRALVISRKHRPLSSSLRAHLETGKVEFEITDEQEALIDVYPFDAVTPANTISRIVTWMSESEKEASIVPHWSVCAETLLTDTEEERPIVERAIRVGPQHLFAITSEPAGDAFGPWIVLLGGVHEDHTGPSRLWVEIPRRWAAAGLRCVRIDVSGMGESPRGAEDPPMQINDPVWIRDVNTIGPSLTTEEPSNCVYVGYCSGATLALEGAFGCGARGVCVVNLPSGIDYAHAISRLENAPTKTAAFISRILRRLPRPYPAVREFISLSFNTLLPKRWFTNIAGEIMSRGTKVFALVGPDELSAYRNVPVLRKFDERLTSATRPYSSTLVPNLDHDMTFAAERTDMARLLENYVKSQFAPTPHLRPGHVNPDDDNLTL
jgi:pimeloyl-ACP methyl ester carboxylesterase